MKTLRQLVRYGIVGLTSNGILYLFYLLLTSFGVGHKLAATLGYALGVAQTYFFNKSWSFGHTGESRAAFIRYVLAYLSGYVLNLAVLAIFVDVLGYPHQLIQGLMILLLAGYLFVLQKYWVFPEGRLSSEAS